MKIKTTVTEIECSAEELRQSSSLSDGFWNIFRNAFNGPIHDDEEFEEAADDKADSRL